VTAKVQPREVAEFKAMGAVGVIAKPFDPMALADQVRNLWKNVFGRRLGGCVIQSDGWEGGKEVDFGQILSNE
ncbi:MAG: hypothetical protein WCP34_08360, partial [Pseudomonadota bacterium]